MALTIHNSLTKKKEVFVPAVPDQVNIYTCGVTVYDDCHVGHGRSLFIFDSFKRYLEFKGYKVKLVRNITDVDDKIINRAREEGVSFETVRKRYIDAYYRDLEDLEIRKADFEPLATENINYMIGHIKKLIETGYAYAADGDVYFSVRAFAPYGRLSGQSVEDMLTAVRIEKDEKKKDPLDFALWKKSKEGEPSWPSPWGPGRPGWHIECSTMSLRFLRVETLDIHAGGRDLIFPHHENEIAQAEALTGKPFATYWIHHGLLTINGQKMSKSLGNFVTLREVLGKFRPDVLKLFFLGAHYGSAMDFSFEGLQKSQRAAEKIEEFLSRAQGVGPGSEESCGSGSEEEVRRAAANFEKAMDDDFNTAQALAALFELVGLGNKYLAAGDGAAARRAADELTRLGRVLGLGWRPSSKVMEVGADQRIKVDGAAASSLSQQEIEGLLAERRAARRRKDFRRADEIRAYLKERGVTVEDKEKSS